MNWKSIKQPDIDIYLWSSGAQDGGGLIGVTLHPGPFSIHQERCMDRLKVKTRSVSWETTDSQHQHQIISKFDEKHYVIWKGFTSPKIKSQAHASNHLGSLRLNVNAGGREKEREGWGERDGDASDLDLVLQARMMIEEEEIPLSRQLPLINLQISNSILTLKNKILLRSMIVPSMQIKTLN